MRHTCISTNGNKILNKKKYIYISVWAKSKFVRMETLPSQFVRLLFYIIMLHRKQWTVGSEYRNLAVLYTMFILHLNSLLSFIYLPHYDHSGTDNGNGEVYTGLTDSPQLVQSTSRYPIIPFVSTLILSSSHLFVLGVYIVTFKGVYTPKFSTHCLWYACYMSRSMQQPWYSNNHLNNINGKV
jgi:hypothetical protein